MQEALDSRKSRQERNRLGQFATPHALARDIILLAKQLMGREQVRFLDPAFGTGSFYSSLLQEFPSACIESAGGYEIDPHYALPALDLWKGTGLDLRVGDFTKAKPPSREHDKPNLLVCNPPYVRHHHMPPEYKKSLREASFAFSGADLNGLAGLYCYFLAISHAWMAKDGLAIWLIPTEFMDVNYGQAIKDYLLDKVTVHRIHRFDPKDVQFADALVSSAVICFANTPPPADHQIQISFGGSVTQPEHRWALSADSLRRTRKWTGALVPASKGVAASSCHLSDFFDITRGIATGDNDFFVMSAEQAQARRLPPEFLLPVLPSPRYLNTEEILADDEGLPLLDQRLFLLNCRLPAEVVKDKHPALWAYLAEGISRKVHEGYLCTHREPWYSQEARSPSPFLCTYMGRGGRERPAFRFILNHSRAIATNVYLHLYPKGNLRSLLKRQPRLQREIWSALQSITMESLKGVGRVYGGGLHKVEPNELANASADPIIAALPGLSPETLFPVR